MIRILQINMYRSATAHQLLTQLVAEVNDDLVLINEQYRNKDPSPWYLDLSGTAAIWVWDDVRLRVLAEGRGNEFIWIRCLGITVFSVYLTPDETMPDFSENFSASDHQYIAFKVVECRENEHREVRRSSWSRQGRAGGHSGGW